MELENLYVIKNIFDPSCFKIRDVQEKATQKNVWLGRAVGAIGGLGLIAFSLVLPLLVVSERIIRIAANILGVLTFRISCSLGHAFCHFKKVLYEGTLGLIFIGFRAFSHSAQFSTTSIVVPKNAKNVF